MKTFETFAGYGGWSFGMCKAGLNHEKIGFSEIDKYAIQCYKQNHRDIKNFGDITKIESGQLPDFDMMLASPPCQAFSVAGRGEGKEDSKGRGRLFEDTIKIMKDKQPKFAWYENVKGLVSKKHSEYYYHIMGLMEEAGYRVYWKVMNTKNHNIPQNRERVFILCVRNDIKGDYKFPEQEELQLCLKDILEEEVDKKYYLSDEKVESLLKSLKPEQIEEIMNKSQVTMPCITSERASKRQNGRRFKNDGEDMFTLNTQDRHGILQIGTIKQICKKRTNDTPSEINQYLKRNKRNLTISEISTKLNLPKTKVEHYFRTDYSRAIPSAEDWKRLKILLNLDDTWDNAVTEIHEKEVQYESTRRVYSENGCSPTISCTNPDKMILQINQPKHSNDRVYDPEGISPTLNTMQGGHRQPFIIVKNATKKGYMIAYPGDGISLGFPNSKTRRGRVQPGIAPTLQCNDERGVVTYDLRIRKLTPKECFRLQGFLNDEINVQNLSESQQYKLAGNGVSINVIERLMRKLKKTYPEHIDG